MCQKDVETGSHLFIHCDYARRIWDHVLISIDYSFMMPRSVIDLMRQWHRRLRGVRGKLFMGVIIHGILWGNYLERAESRIFEDKKRLVSVLNDSIFGEVRSWLMVDKNFKDLSLNYFMMDWVTTISSSPFYEDAFGRRFLLWKAR